MLCKLLAAQLGGERKKKHKTVNYILFVGSHLTQPKKNISTYFRY